MNFNPEKESDFLLIWVAGGGPEAGLGGPGRGGWWSWTRVKVVRNEVNAVGNEGKGGSRRGKRRMEGGRRGERRPAKKKVTA